MNADFPAFLISLQSISSPMTSMTKNSAMDEINARSSEGKTKPNIVGPRIIPASNSPPNAGCFILLKSSPKILAPASKITIEMKICSIANLKN